MTTQTMTLNSHGAEMEDGHYPSDLGHRHVPRKQVLVVDDMPSIRESLGKLLRRRGYAVALAENGRVAIDRALRERFDLVLLDLSMPELDGWETLRILSKSRPDLPIVVMTAHPDQRIWVEPAGAWALLEKPLNMTQLLDTVRELAANPTGTRRAPGIGTLDRFRHHWPEVTVSPSLHVFRAGISE